MFAWMPIQYFPLVRWLVGPLIVLTQFGNPLRLTLDGHEIVIGDVEKRKHVAADIKHQYALATFNLGKGNFSSTSPNDRQ